MKIGVKNFRVLKELQTFDIRPITILLGPNNSGKSSLTKLLRLFKNGYHYKLDFKSGSHNLKNFDSIINHDSDSDILKFQIEHSILILPENYYTELTYFKGQLSGVSVENPDGELIYRVNQFPIKPRRNKESGGIRQHGYDDDDYYLEFTFNLKGFLDNFYSKGWIKKVKLNFDSFDTKIAAHPELLLSNASEYMQDIARKLINEKSFDEYRTFRNSGNLNELKLVALHNEITLLKKDYCLYNVKIGGKPITKKQLYKATDFVLKCYNEHWRRGDLGTGAWDNFFWSSSNDYIDDILQKELINHVRNNINHVENQKIEITHTRLGELVFSEKLFDEGSGVMDIRETPNLDFLGTPQERLNEGKYWLDNLDVLSFRGVQTAIELLRNYDFSFSRWIKAMQYIPPNRGTNKRVLTDSSETIMDQTIREYYDLIKNTSFVDNYVRFGGNADLPTEFVNSALNLFGLEGELEISSVEDFALMIYLKQKDKKIPFADLGYGYSQLLPIIIQSLLLKDEPKIWESSHPSVIIVEEPEENLHPNLQSKLADLFTMSRNELGDVHYIIETHSEYLIRKLQYLVAEGSLKKEDVIIYYFNDDKYVSEEEPKVKEIEITENGNLTDTFGPGFYDEATKLKFDLMRVNKEQKN
ncbi:DUF3696 domain-containing protein [Eudoraea adriatica]|uniref:DUF3696 domain-containing protein n=1 Tax=Eudoraea adriatica TaxID=446681 RepID=UPI000361E968|nr:DUF3696 domain-containing protein [Eudoraea adriatica]